MSSSTNRWRSAAIAMFSLLGLQAHAEWSGKGELGLVLARGNSETETISAKADVEGKYDKWKHLAGFSILQSKSGDEQTADRYEVHAQSNYSMTDRAYALGSVRYEDDQFSSYTYQAVATLGVGYRFFDADDLKLSGELGVGYRRTEDRLSGETNGETIVRAAANYEQLLTATTTIYDKLLVESGSDNTYVQNALGVKVSINAKVALSVAYEVRYNTDVDPPRESTDELLTANLVFAF